MELGVLVVLINNVLTLTVGDPDDASIVLIITVLTIFGDPDDKSESQSGCPAGRSLVINVSWQRG